MDKAHKKYLELAAMSDIVRVAIGEEFTLQEGGQSYFGSGGGWGFIRYAADAAEPVRLGDVPDSECDNGFVSVNEGRYVFRARGSVIAKQGDSIGDGRVLYKKVVVCVGEPLVST